MEAYQSLDNRTYAFKTKLHLWCWKRVRTLSIICKRHACKKLQSKCVFQNEVTKVLCGFPT